ncbi:unnamed protein product [Prunus armeniaca]
MNAGRKGIHNNEGADVLCNHLRPLPTK